MDIDDLYQEVRSEIEGTHEFVELLEANRQSRASARLNLIAILALPLALALSVLGLSLVIPGIEADQSWALWDKVKLMVLVVTLTYLLTFMVWVCWRTVSAVLVWWRSQGREGRP